MRESASVEDEKPLVRSALHETGSDDAGDVSPAYYWSNGKAGANPNLFVGRLKMSFSVRYYIK
jgi:hypothetical protein